MFNLLLVNNFLNNNIIFAGVKLDSNTKEIEWNPQKESQEQEGKPRHNLIINQAVLR